MSEQIKKPLYKKWWIWLIAVIVIGGVIGATSDDNEATENGLKEETPKEIKKKEVEKEESDDDSALSDEDVDLIKGNLEESLKAEMDFGDIFYLDEFDYDADSNKILARVDMQQDPLPETKEDVIEWAEAWSWSIVETNPDIDKTYNVRVNLVSKVDDGYIAWGRSTYDSGTQKYHFKADDGMKLYE